MTHDVPFGHERLDGVLYEPVGQFVPDTLNCVVVLASMRTVTGGELKFAVMTLGASIVTLSGFVEPAADPLQPVNSDPA